MDAGYLRSGIVIAAGAVAGIIVLFAVYLKMGTMARKDIKKLDE